MWYMGGKQRQAKALLQVLSLEPTPATYVEPFCGALGSAEKLVPYFGAKGVPIVLSDSSKPLVTLLNAVLLGSFKLPDWTSENTYAQYAISRHSPDCDDPMTAWCGYALSFGGKWFGGFARGGNKGQSSEVMQVNQKKALLRKIRAIRPYVERVRCSDYRTLEYQTDSIIYMDPPYASRTIAHHTAKSGFDSGQFWDFADRLSHTCRVFVSEFKAPDKWEPVFVWGDTVVRHNNSNKLINEGTSESLYKLGTK